MEQTGGKTLCTGLGLGTAWSGVNYLSRLHYIELFDKLLTLSFQSGKTGRVSRQPVYVFLCVLLLPSLSRSF